MIYRFVRLIFTTISYKYLFFYLFCVKLSYNYIGCGYMKKNVTIFLILVVTLMKSSFVNAIELDISSKNAILYNLDENKVLYEKNSNERIAIAFMTKIMTAIVAIENIENLDEKVTLIWKDFAGLVEANASVAGFKYGQIVTYRDLLYGLLLPSGADAAQALTRLVAGGRNNFVQMMNKKAKDLDLKNTHFMNETGLDEEGHYSTVEDVAIIFQYALKNKLFKEIITSISYTISDNSMIVYSTIYKNKIRYGLTLDYIKGGKTGTTGNAGSCLASVATWNDVNYMLVTAGAPYNDGPKNLLDAKIIYEYFINNYGNKFIVQENDKILILDTLYTKEDNVIFYAKSSYQKYLYNDFNKEDLKYEYDGEKVITSKMKSGTKLGKLTIKYQDEVLYEQDIILENELSFDLIKYLKAHIEIIIIGIITILAMLIFWIIRKIRNKNRVLKQSELEV